MFRIVSRARRVPFSTGLAKRSFRPARPCLVVQKNSEIYVGYNPDRTLEEVDVYAATSTREPEAPTEYQLYGHREFSFSNQFLSSSTTMHEIKEGGYVSVSEEDLATYLPDAMGEVQPEFEYSETKAWMIRDSTKLLCRIIEEYETGKTKVSPPSNDADDRTQQGVALRAQLEGLTDRPERSDAVLKVFRRGKQISGDARPSIGNFDIMCGPGSMVENVVDEIKKGDEWNKPELPTQILVTGVRGTGKSFTLNQTVMYARKRGWLVMVVDAWRQAQYGWFVEPYKFRSEIPGTDKIFDNAFMSAEVLRSFYKAHKDTLSTIPIANADTILDKYKPDLAKFREEWDRTVPLAGAGAKFIQIRRMIEGGDNFEEQDALDEEFLRDFDFPNAEFKSLADLIILGLFYRDFAGAVAMDVIEQLKNLESHRVLFAVDGYNSWEVPSAYEYEGSKVMPKQMCVPRSLNFLSRQKAEQSKWSVKNGLAIGFTSYKHPPQLKDVYHDSMKSFQLVLKLPVYSCSEYLSAMRLYLENSGLFENDITTQELIGFRMLCASNPRLARLESFGFFLPLSAQRHADNDDPYDDSALEDFTGGDREGSGRPRKGDRDVEDDGYGDDMDDFDSGNDDSSDTGDIADEDVKF